MRLTWVDERASLTKHKCVSLQEEENDGYVAQLVRAQHS